MDERLYTRGESEMVEERTKWSAGKEGRRGETMREEREGTAEGRETDDIGGLRNNQRDPSDGGRRAASAEKRIHYYVQQDNDCTTTYQLVNS